MKTKVLLACCSGCTRCYAGGFSGSPDTVCAGSSSRCADSFGTESLRCPGLALEGFRPN